MGTLHWLNRKRLEKSLAHSACEIVVVTRVIEGLPDSIRERYPQSITLNVGAQIHAPCVFEEDHFTTTLDFGINKYVLYIHYAGLFRIRNLNPPTGGGTPISRAA